MKCILRNIILLLLISPAVKAQDFTAILRSIEQHSTSLEAARMEAEAEKKESKLINAYPYRRETTQAPLLDVAIDVIFFEILLLCR